MGNNPIEGAVPAPPNESPNERQGTGTVPLRAMKCQMYMGDFLRQMDNLLSTHHKSPA